MPTSFLPEITPSADLRIAFDVLVSAQPDRETIRLLAIGSRRGVQHVIHLLHIRNVAAAGDWSPLLPGPNPGEVMSILTLSFAIS